MKQDLQHEIALLNKRVSALENSHHVSLSPEAAAAVRSLAKARNTTSTQILNELVGQHLGVGEDYARH